MQLYMSWYIRSFFGFTFLNILYFFKYSCTNIFHRRSLYTFYYTIIIYLAELPSFKAMHYIAVIMGTMASQITSLAIVYSTVYSGADQRKHQSSASLAFVWGIHRGPVNSPHKWPVTRKMFPFDDVIMVWCITVVEPSYKPIMALFTVALCVATPKIPR